MASVLLYGATGYMGQLVTQYALKESWAQEKGTFILAGRSQRVRSQADLSGIESRIFDLNDPRRIAEHLAGVDLVINVAGPFALTGVPLATACIRSGTHYVDIAGEVPEFEALYQLREDAQQADVMLMPGVGFGVVPTDLLALALKQKLSTATSLILAYATEGGVSQGTLRTVLKDLCKPGVKRVEDNFEISYPGAKQFPFRVEGQAFSAVTNPWRADLFTAYLTTAIPTIETYSVFPDPLPLMMRHPAWFGRMLQSRAMQKLIGRLPSGPSEIELAQGKTYVYGQVTNPEGESAIATLIGPEAYLFSALTTLAIVRRILEGQIEPGFQTVGQVYGLGLLQEIEGVYLSLSSPG